MPRDCSEEEREAISMDVDRDLKAELKDCNTLNVMKIMGAIVNPLFQNKKRMMAAGLCTELQYEHGTAELIRRIARAYDRIEGAVEIVNDPNRTRNEWSSSDDDNAGAISIVTLSTKKAANELDVYLSYMKSKYQPTMEPTKTLGTYDDGGNPREHPIISIGKVTQRGSNLPSHFNLADYVNPKGHFDLVGYVQDHSTVSGQVRKPPFIGVGNVIIG